MPKVLTASTALLELKLSDQNNRRDVAVTQTMESMTISVHAMQWNKLDHISDVRPIEPTDVACLDRSARFSRGMGHCRVSAGLLHSHFELAMDQ